jgi:hypothetical protein
MQRSDRKETATECTRPGERAETQARRRATEAQSRGSGVVLDALQLSAAVPVPRLERARATGPITRIVAWLVTELCFST